MATTLNKNKTPVAIVQEYLLRKRITPVYDLICDGTGTHDPIFKFEVSACNNVAIGTGKSKKEAKHDAARNLLRELLRSNPSLSIELGITFKDVNSPYDRSLKENAVGDLFWYCSTYNFKLPEYSLIKDEGPPHAKRFTFVCSIGCLQAQACSRTKKQAKHIAAKKLLCRVKEFLRIIPSYFKIPRPCFADLSCKQTEQLSIQDSLSINDNSTNYKQIFDLCEYFYQLTIKYELPAEYYDIKEADLNITNVKVIQPDIPNAITCDDTAVSTKVKDPKLIEQPENVIPWGLPLDDYRFRGPDITDSDILHDIRKNKIDIHTIKNPVDTLNLITQKLDYNLEIGLLPLSGIELITAYILLSSNKCPIWEFCGSAETELEAKNIAARRAIRFLNIMSINKGASEKVQT